MENKTYDLILEKYKKSIFEMSKIVSQGEMLYKTPEEREEYKIKKEKAIRKSKLLARILTNNRDTWEESDISLRNNNYNYLLRKGKYIDKVARKLNNLENFYKSNLLNVLMGTKEDERETIRSFKNHNIDLLRTRKMNKSEYDYILNTSEKRIIKEILKKVSNESYKDIPFLVSFEPLA